MNLYGSTQLREREEQVVALVAAGMKNKDIAATLGITEHMVKNYLSAVFDKLGMWNRTEVALWFEARKPKENL